MLLCYCDWRVWSSRAETNISQSWSTVRETPRGTRRGNLGKIIILSRYQNWYQNLIKRFLFCFLSTGYVTWCILKLASDFFYVCGHFESLLLVEGTLNPIQFHWIEIEVRENLKKKGTLFKLCRKIHNIQNRKKYSFKRYFS